MHKIYSAVGSFGSGSSLGLTVTASGAQVTQSSTPQNGALASLNESGCQYKLVAVRLGTA